MGTMVAPVVGSGSWPAWIARVAKPGSRALMGASIQWRASGDSLPILWRLACKWHAPARPTAEQRGVHAVVAVVRVGRVVRRQAAAHVVFNHADRWRRGGILDCLAQRFDARPFLQQIGPRTLQGAELVALTGRQRGIVEE